MRLVVGPLPASVYWRRRAMVLGGAVIAVLLVMYSCNVGKKSPAASISPSASASAKTAASPTASPTAVTAPVVQASATPSTAPVVAGDPSLCTDAELSVIASPAKNPLPSGTEVQINLLIKNVSNRECVRDVGADQQELYIVLGTEKIWSSDNCGALTGTDQRTFPPQHERSYRVIWNGKSSSTCANKAPSGATPTPGEYQLFGRVGTDLSDPVTLKLT